MMHSTASSEKDFARIDTDDLGRLSALGPAYRGSEGGIFYAPPVYYECDVRLKRPQLMLNLGPYRSVARCDSDREVVEESLTPAASFLPNGTDIRDHCDSDLISDFVIFMLSETFEERVIERAGLDTTDLTYSYGWVDEDLQLLGQRVRSLMLEGAVDTYDSLALDTLIDETEERVANLLVDELKPGKTLRKGGLTKRQLRRVRDLVHSRMDEQISLEEMASEAGLSRHHFARQFRATAGVSPYDYVLSRRLDYAISLLRKGRDKLAEIAIASGFADQAHLSKQFKKRIGLTPRDYRRIICA